MICNFFAFLVQGAATTTADSPVNGRAANAAGEIDAETDWLYWD